MKHMSIIPVCREVVERIYSLLSSAYTLTWFEECWLKIVCKSVSVSMTVDFCLLDLSSLIPISL